MIRYLRFVDFTKREFVIVVTLSLVLIAFVCVKQVCNRYSLSTGVISISGESQNINYLIDINRADWHEFMLLPKIGEVKAKTIVRYRNENGDFQRVEDLCNINGIGESTLKKISGLIVVKQESGERN